MDNLIKVGGAHNYSTQEHIVGKWIDGSDVYERTISKTITKGTSTLGELPISLLISIKGSLTTTNRMYNVNYLSGDNTNYFYMYITDGKYLSYSASVNGTANITIQYIK